MASVQCENCGMIIPIINEADPILNENNNSPKCKFCDKELKNLNIESIREELRIEKKREAQERAEEAQIKANIAKRQAKMKTPRGLEKAIHNYLNEGVEFIIVKYPYPALNSLDYPFKHEQHRDYAIEKSIEIFRKYVELSLPEPPTERSNDPDTDLRKIQIWAIKVDKIITGKTKADSAETFAPEPMDDEGSDAQTTINEDEAKVLNLLNEEFPQVRYQMDIVSNVNITRKTVGKILNRLKEYHLVSHPQDKKKGWQITNKGQEYIKKHFS